MKTLVAASLAIALAGCSLMPAKKTKRYEGPPLTYRVVKVEQAYIDAKLELIKRQIKNPETAQFSNVYATRFGPDQEEPNVCGMVNAQNSYGNYTGGVPFLISYGHVFWWDRSQQRITEQCAL